MRRLVLALLFLMAVAVPILAVLWHRAALRREMLRADPDTVLGTARLRHEALDLGGEVFGRTCAGCHGEEGRGKPGVPDLTDGDWLFGSGRAAEIEAVVRYGIRSHNPKGWNLASMPIYASVRPYSAEPLPSLRPNEVDDVVQLLLSYEGKPAEPAAVERGTAVFAKAGCWDCHGSDGRGDSAIGAPNLRDGITLYGASPEALKQTVEQGRRGVSPAFADKLSAEEIRAVAVFAASLSRPGLTAQATP